MQAARLLDVLLTGLLLLAFLHRCDAAPATSSAVASKALPSVVPPDRSALKEDAWAARFVYNVIQRNANNTAKRALVNRRDDSDLDYAATLSHDDKDLYLIYPWRGDKALPYVAQLVVTNVTLGKGSQGHVYDGYLYQYPDEDTEDKDEDCDGDYVPVAVKVSAGSGDYRSARTFANIQSQYIVKVRQYALKYPENGVGSRVESIVAYEILQESAFNAWVLGTIDQVPFMKAAMKGAIDAARQDVWIMDLKFENYMSKTKAVGADAEWAVVDLGMIVKGDCFAYSEGYAGTYGYMPPGKNVRSGWQNSCGY
ncbi:uncharacterized protein N7459_009941 [Penicillium hispanicum]|uniref:uncharacterized protein n=1 Tax=Penicillium hispanicum TaxID=1080232 RepID=UPI00253F8F58|nr:uncharacterized protein N7459_009941 [Penicillium hispanicum]KAJ5570511.1 hypothetical protein N7459_009941 [Penicillium hispanicum]